MPNICEDLRPYGTPHMLSRLFELLLGHRHYCRPVVCQLFLVCGLILLGRFPATLLKMNRRSF
ncbi:hypothetical protein P4S72_21825 [Vibrio sp. PP-XX7]